MPEKKKILLVHSTLHIGGAEEVSANICRRIDRDRFDVHVCFLKEKGVVAEKIEGEGTTVHAVAKPQRDKPDYFTSWRLRRLIRKERFDLIHSHDVHSLMDGSLCRMTSPGLRHVHTFHYGNYPERAANFQRIERATWRMPDRLVSVSEHQRKGLLELYGMPPHRVKTVWNGVDVLPELPAEPTIGKYRQQGRIVIGSVNTLIEQKGMPDLIKVAAKLKSMDVPPFVFLIAGGGPLQEELQEELKRLDLQDHVEFLGWVKQAPQSVIPHIDIFFQPSLWEAMSMVLLESMALGRAIVATAVGETPRILEDGRHGRVLQARDIDGMTAAMASLLRDESLRSRMGAEARQHYHDHFTAQRLAERHEALYAEVCA